MDLVMTAAVIATASTAAPFSPIVLASVGIMVVIGIVFVWAERAEPASNLL